MGHLGQSEEINKFVAVHEDEIAPHACLHALPGRQRMPLVHQRLPACHTSANAPNMTHVHVPLHTFPANRQGQSADDLLIKIANPLFESPYRREIQS